MALHKTTEGRTFVSFKPSIGMLAIKSDESNPEAEPRTYEDPKTKEKKTVQGHKLNATQVMRIKKMIADPERKTRMKMIAKQFNISEMQLYRIKSGENWGHIVIGEPLPV